MAGTGDVVPAVATYTIPPMPSPPAELAVVDLDLLSGLFSFFFDFFCLGLLVMKK